VPINVPGYIPVAILGAGFAGEQEARRSDQRAGQDSLFR